MINKVYELTTIIYTALRLILLFFKNQSGWASWSWAPCQAVERPTGYDSIRLINQNLTKKTDKNKTTETLKTDAIFKIKKQKIHLEVVCIKDGEYEKYQFDHLDLFRWAPDLEITTKDLFNSIKMKQQRYSTVASVTDMVNNAINSTNHAIQDKIFKTLSEGTILIVYLSLGPFFTADLFSDFFKKIIIPKNNFSEIHIITPDLSGYCSQSARIT